MEAQKFSTFQQLLDYNAGWIQKPTSKSLINGTLPEGDLASLDIAGDALVRINQLGYLTDSSQTSEVEGTYTEKAYLSGWMENNQAENLSDKLNLGGYICLLAPMKLMIDIDKASMKSPALQEYICSTRIPVTAVDGEYRTFVGVMPETYFLKRVTPELKTKIANNYSWIICVDPNHGISATHPKHGLFTKVIEYLQTP